MSQTSPVTARDELIKRLVGRADAHDKMCFGSPMGLGYFSGNDARLVWEAADEIESLREELESAKAQVHIALHSNGFQLLGLAQTPNELLMWAAEVAEKGAKQCSDGDSEWHRGFRYAADNTAKGIAADLRRAALAVSSTADAAQCSQQWPDIREIHDAIANNLVNELTYSSIRNAAIEVQERYTAALSGTTDRTHSFVDAGFDTCRFCGERKSHADHTPAVSDTSTSHEGGK